MMPTERGTAEAKAEADAKKKEAEDANAAPLPEKVSSHKPHAIVIHSLIRALLLHNINLPFYCCRFK